MNVNYADDKKIELKKGGFVVRVAYALFRPLVKKDGGRIFGIPEKTSRCRLFWRFVLVGSFLLAAASFMKPVAWFFGRKTMLMHLHDTSDDDGSPAGEITVPIQRWPSIAGFNITPALLLFTIPAFLIGNRLGLKSEEKWFEKIAALDNTSFELPALWLGGLAALGFITYKGYQYGAEVVSVLSWAAIVIMFLLGLVGLFVLGYRVKKTKPGKEVSELVTGYYRDHKSKWCPDVYIVD